MFGFFKKKRQPMASLNDRSLDVALCAAVMIDLTMLICRSVKNFEEKLQSQFVRGYFVGFLDAASQSANLDLRSDEEFFEFIIKGHVFLKDDLRDTDSYAIASLGLRQESKFSEGMSAGWSDYFDSLQGKLSYRRQLLNYFHDS